MLRHQPREKPEQAGCDHAHLFQFVGQKFDFFFIFILLFRILWEKPKQYLKKKKKAQKNVGSPFLGEKHVLEAPRTCPRRQVETAPFQAEAMCTQLRGMCRRALWGATELKAWVG